MASPVGHALIGIGCAAVVAQIAGTPPSFLLWLGTIIASNIPDLDFIGAILGLSKPRLHRWVTHSVPILIGFSLAAAWVWSLLVGSINSGLCLAWVTALLSHPLLDLVTTGPVVAARGYGIALLWPIDARRWYLHQPVYEAAEFDAYRSARGIWQSTLSEIYRLGPIALLLILLANLF